MVRVLTQIILKIHPYKQPNKDGHNVDEPTVTKITFSQIFKNCLQMCMHHTYNLTKHLISIDLHLHVV